MAFQETAFFFFHALREAGEANITLAPSEPANAFPLHDGRLGELMQWTTDLGAGGKQVTVTRSDTPENDAIDTLILAGHNVSGAQVDVAAGATDMLDPNYIVTEANGTPVVIPLTLSVDVSTEADIRFAIQTTGAPTDSIVPELTEAFFTVKRELTRGPEFNWTHDVVRNQNTQGNDAGVTSTRLLGANRKRHVMTWRHLAGTDRQIMLDLIEQTDGLSQPFWFLPPDDIYPIQFVEVDRDSNWQQDFMAPLTSGTSDKVTLSMIQALG